MATPSQAIHATGTPMHRPQGFQDLYERHAEAVFRAAFRVTGNAADAEDVLQTVFLRMLHHQERFDPTTLQGPYLRRAATNAAIDVLRRKAAKAEVEIDDTREHGTREDTALLRERLRRAIATLDEEDASIFLLRYIEGLSNGELAREFGIEPGTVASRLFRIRQALRKEIER